MSVGGACDVYTLTLVGLGLVVLFSLVQWHGDVFSLFQGKALLDQLHCLGSGAWVQRCWVRIRGMNSYYIYAPLPRARA